MPYGVKRGVKAPGEFNVADMFGFGLAGAAGIVAALVTDYQQKGEASALFTINQWVVQLGSLLGFTNIPLWMVVVGLTAAGAGSIFYFQPITRQGAFAQGFGLLAVLMTAVPPDLAGGIEAMTESLPGLEPASATVREAKFENPVGAPNAAIAPANFIAAAASIVPAQAQAGPSRYDVYLTVTFPEGLPDDVDSMIRRGILRGRLHNEGTNETWNMFRSAGGSIERQGDSLMFKTGVPARSGETRLWVRIECPGYAIEEQSALVAISEPLEWNIEMSPSNVPLFLQRLGKSYWF